MPNRLAASTSPYLLQHKDNPVDWWEWSAEAFAEARRRDVPVLISVGYAACHWCHVMATESFEDAASAEVVNTGFVAIKVDREERPDVDAVYMRATTALTRHGGWPMTVFATPDGRPFHAGTYFPPTERHGMPSFTQVLQAVSETWTSRRPEVEAAADRLAAAIGADGNDDVANDAAADAPSADTTDLLGFAAPSGLPQGLARAAVASLAADEDRHNGGFGTAPKFPPSMVLDFLLREGSEQAVGLAGRALVAMARSGMYDQVEGGFARYSVDASWTVPHFEKMLYDNAQLARVYARWWVLTGEETGRRVAEETCDWMLAALGTAEGALASALDADTPAPHDGSWPAGLPHEGLPGTAHGIEGLTYVWTRDSLVDALGAEEGAWVADLLGVTATGTFEAGTSTARLTRDPWADEAEAARWRASRDLLRGVRAGRPQPARDDKVVAAWNGLAISALAETGALTGRDDLVAAAQRVARLLVDVHVEAGPGGTRLRRVSRDGVVGTPAGVLEDHGAVAAGLLVLHGVDGDPAWVRTAVELCDTVATRFADRRMPGLLRDTADDGLDDALAAALGGRSTGLHDPADNAYPSGASVATGALVHAAALTGRTELRELADAALARALPLIQQAPRFAGWWLAVAEAAADGPREVAVVGRSGDPRRAVLHALALRSSAPGLVVSVGEPGSVEPPLLVDRGERDGGAAAYVCRGFVCDAPMTSEEPLRESLRR